MKKITSKNLSKRLAHYSALSLAIAGVADAQGQIIYTDIDPDGGGFDSTYDLDLNNDATIEFTIFTGQTSAGPINAVGMNASAAGNSFVGSAPGAYEYPFALNSGDVISSGQTTWFDANANTGTLNYMSCYNGTGSSNWCGMVDKYLGLRFTLNGNLHYGWARLDVDAAGMNWSIKDYAYNSVAGASIDAGQTLSVEEFSTNDIKIVALNKSIGLYNMPEATNFNLYDISGKSVLNGTTSGNQFVIEANGVSNGIYILELSDPNSDAIIRKKIVL